MKRKPLLNVARHLAYHNWRNETEPESPAEVGGGPPKPENTFLELLLLGGPQALVSQALKVTVSDYGNLAGWLEQWAGSSEDFDFLVKLEKEIPPQTVNLRAFALQLSKRIKALLNLGRGQSMSTSDKACLLNNISVRFIDFEELELARDSAHVAVLAATEAALSSEDELPIKGAALNNYAEALATLGSVQEALHAAEEATAVYKFLLQTRKGNFWHNLALSLKHVADLRGHADGEAEKAAALLEASQAVHIFRDLVKVSESRVRELANHVTQHDAPFQDAAAWLKSMRIGLAASRNSEAIRLLDLQSYSDALTAATEADDILQELRSADEDQFAPASADAAATLAHCLAHTQQWHLALKKAEAAAAGYAALERVRPLQFGPLKIKALDTVERIRGLLCPAASKL